MLVQIIKCAEAIQWDGRNISEISKFTNKFKNVGIYENIIGKDTIEPSTRYDLYINGCIVSVGDYLINTGDGTLCACKGDEFNIFSRIVSAEVANNNYAAAKSKASNIREKLKEIFKKDFDKGNVSGLTITYDIKTDECSVCLVNSNKGQL